MSGGGAIFIRGGGSLRTVSEMFLALKEMRRAKVRFGLLIVAIGLLVFLILFQQSLQNSLLRGFTGALRSQSAPVLVYSTDGQRTLQASVLTPELEALASVRATVSARSGGSGRARSPSRADGSIAEASIIGYETVGPRLTRGPQRGPAAGAVRVRPWPAPRTPATGSTSATS